MAHSSPREKRRLIVLPDQGDYKVLQVSDFHVIQDPRMSDFAVAKANMIESQIRPSGVTKASIIDAIAAVPRERFVPRSRQSVAYVGGEVEVAPGRCLLDPTVFARMIAAAEIQAPDLVLDVGCATGYSTAVLAALCDVVVAVEEDEALADQAQEVLGDIGIDNCAVVRGPWPPENRTRDLTMLSSSMEPSGRCPMIFWRNWPTVDGWSQFMAPARTAWCRLHCARVPILPPDPSLMLRPQCCPDSAPPRNLLSDNC